MEQVAKTNVPIRSERHNPQRHTLVHSKFRLNQNSIYKFLHFELMTLDAEDK